MMKSPYSLLFVAALLGSWPVAPSQAAPAKITLTLTQKACTDGGTLLTLTASVNAFVVDARGLKLAQQPKELLIMRKPVSFFRIPWAAGKTSYDVSPSTAKPVFGEDGLFPLRQGEKLMIGLMSPKDEIIVSCNVAVN